MLQIYSFYIQEDCQLHNIVLGLILLTVSFSSLADSNTQAEREILSVIDKFEHSLKNKKREVFKSLFLHNDIPFIAVFTDKMVKARRKTNPDFPRSVDFGQFGNNIENMIPEEASREERITNVKIIANKYIATATFKYEDFFNGKLRAYGDENWSLIKNEDGWKIASITYTVTENSTK